MGQDDIRGARADECQPVVLLRGQEYEAHQRCLTAGCGCASCESYRESVRNMRELCELSTEIAG